MAWPSNDHQRTETERLFADSVPSVPLSSSAPQLNQPLSQQQQPRLHHQPQQHTVNLSAAPPTALEGGFWQENTLDESVWQTLKRDVLTIGRNLRSVLIPVNWDFHNHTAALHNWDLWGPLIFMLSLAITLSVGERKPSDVFALAFTEVARGAALLIVNAITGWQHRISPEPMQTCQPLPEWKACKACNRGWQLTRNACLPACLHPLSAPPPLPAHQLVFTEVALGAVVLTVNVILLGGNIVFFQSLCLIGYCLFPIVLAAVICTLVKISWVRTVVLVVCLGWASWATVPFIGKTVSEQRRALAVYPVLLMYVSIGWLALVKS